MDQRIEVINREPFADADEYARIERKVRDLGSARETRDRVIKVTPDTFGNEPTERYIVHAARLDRVGSGDPADGYVFVEKTGPEGWRIVLPLRVARAVTSVEDQLFDRSTPESRKRHRASADAAKRRELREVGVMSEAQARKLQAHEAGEHNSDDRTGRGAKPGMRGCPGCKGEGRDGA